MSSKDKPIEKNPETCPGLRDLLQPKPAYIKCHVCGGDLEIWSDEDKTTVPVAEPNGNDPTKPPRALNTANTPINAEASSNPEKPNLGFH